MATYTLKFSCSFSSNDEKKPTIQLSWAKEAKESLYDPDFWYEWIEATMKDACEEESVSEGDIDIQTITLTPASANGSFEGSITWTSKTEVDKEFVEEAVEWRIGDRMCFYAFQEEDWHCYIHPGELL